jgi:hypothetical protein
MASHYRTDLEGSRLPLSRRRLLVIMVDLTIMSPHNDLKEQCSTTPIAKPLGRATRS